MKVTVWYRKESVKISIDKKGRTILSIEDGDLDTYRLAKCLYDGAGFDTTKELQIDNERIVFFQYKR